MRHDASRPLDWPLKEILDALRVRLHLLGYVHISKPTIRRTFGVNEIMVYSRRVARRLLGELY